MKKIVFAGSRTIGYRCLEYLLENQDKFDAEVVGVLTNDEQVLGSTLIISELAAKHGVPWIPSLADYLELPQVDILLSVQYHEILKKAHIDKAAEIAINLHMAPLPEYRGCNQFSFAIDNEDEEFGTTFHRLEEGIDSGAILFEKRFPIPPDCWVQDLYELTVEKSYELFEEYLERLVRGDYTPVSQEEYLDKRSTSLHYRKEIHTLKQIDPNWDAERIYRRLRATYMPGYPPPFMMLEGRKILLSLEDE
jgi:methionyl-tRNA formyltransferase